jgi:hypothetical protein
MSIYETLSNIQVELKAPKNLYNSFGKYKYRNAESILEAAKPLCAKHGCTLTVSDEVILIGDRYYIKATATVQDKDGSAASTTALAREDETKKGMDGAQITGTASSYARKCALNGLFCIDDTKDPDSDEYHNQTAAEPQRDTNAAAARLAARAECQRAVKSYCQKNNADEADAWKLIAETIGKPSKDFTAEDWKQGQQIAEAWK